MIIGNNDINNIKILNLDDFRKKVLELLKIIFASENFGCKENIIFDYIEDIINENILYSNMKNNKDDFNKFNEIFNTRDQESFSKTLTKNFLALYNNLCCNKTIYRALHSIFVFSFNDTIHNFIRNRHEVEDHWFTEAFHRNFLLYCNFSEIISVLTILKHKTFLINPNTDANEKKLIIDPNFLINSFYQISIKSDNPRLIDFAKYISDYGSTNYNKPYYINLRPDLFLISNRQKFIDLVIENNCYNIFKHMHNNYENTIRYTNSTGNNLINNEQDEQNKNTSLVNIYTLIKAIIHKSPGIIKAIIEFNIDVNKKGILENPESPEIKYELSPLEIAKNLYESSNLKETFADKNGYHLIYTTLYKNNIGKKFQQDLQSMFQYKKVRFKFK